MADSSDCCGSGCNPCILDVYEKQKKILEEGVLTEGDDVLSQVKYCPFLLTSIEVLNSRTKLFSFQAVSLKHPKQSIVLRGLIENEDFELIKKPIRLKMGDYLILKGKYIIDTEQKETISRSYTPILKSILTNGCFQTAIVLYETGKMSKYLNSLMKGDITFWRGPYNEFSYQRNTFKKVIMFGGGTGVVPLYNVARGITEDDSDDTLLYMVVSFRTLAEAILRKQLNNLKAFWNFHVDILLTQQECPPVAWYGESIKLQRLTKDVLKSKFEGSKNDEILVLICGPEKFNKEMESHVKMLGIRNENIHVFW